MICISLYIVGKTLFENQCNACHKIHRRKKSNLDYSFDKENFDHDFLKKFITKEDSSVSVKNKLALKILENFSQYYITHNFSFFDTEATAIIHYIQFEKLGY